MLKAKRTDGFFGVYVVEKLRKDSMQGADTATSVHYNLGKEVRTAIEKIDGTMLDDLPKPEKVFRRLRGSRWRDRKRRQKEGR